MLEDRWGRAVVRIALALGVALLPIACGDDDGVGLGEDASPKDVHAAIREHTLGRGATVGRFGR
jgi:hypothetical protein